MAFIGRLTVWVMAVFAAAAITHATHRWCGWELRTLTGFVSAYIGCWLFPQMRAWEHR